MKSARSNQFLAVLFVAGLFRSGAVADQFGDFDYTSDGTAITITHYTGLGGAVAIPNSIVGLPVTTIGDSAFLPFLGMVTSVTFPNNLTTIGNGAFQSSGLIDVTIGSNVTSIGDGVFASSLSLTNIAVDIANTEYDSDDGVLFNKTRTTLVQCPGQKSGNYVIPGSVSTVGYRAFADCRNLVDVTIPEGVITVSEEAFRQAGLTSLTIPSSVASIGEQAFSSCTGLTSVAIGSGVSSIGQGAFIFCSRLTNIVVAAANATFTANEGVLINSNQTTLIQCPGGKAGSYVIPDDVTEIGKQAFSDCANLTSVVIGNGVTNIVGVQAFAFCDNLTSVIIPDSVVNMGHNTFEGCFNLVRVTVPDSVTTLGASTFEHCRSLTNLYFAGDAPPPFNNVFVGTTNVTVYYLPNTTGWGSTYSGRPAVLWDPAFSAVNLSSGAISCSITGTPSIPIAFETGSNLVSAEWTRLVTTNLTGGFLTFQDPSASANSVRFYRVAGPP